MADTADDAVLQILKGLQKDMVVLRRGQEELRSGQDELRSGQAELRSDMNVGFSDIRGEMRSGFLMLGRRVDGMGKMFAALSNEVTIVNDRLDDLDVRVVRLEDAAASKTD